MQTKMYFLRKESCTIPIILQYTPLKLKKKEDFYVHTFNYILHSLDSEVDHPAIHGRVITMIKDYVHLKNS